MWQISPRFFMKILKIKKSVQQISRLLFIALLLHSNFSLLVYGETTAHTLRQIHLSSEENEIIVVLELDGRPSQFTVYALSNPERVVVDLQGVRYSAEPDLTRLLNKPARQSGMQRITVQNSEEKLRVIFEAFFSAGGKRPCVCGDATAVSNRYW